MIWLLMAWQDVLAEEPVARDAALGPLEERVRQAQSGDRELRNQVITDCLPYVKGVMRRMLPNPFLEQADEYSVALSAFDEAIDRYRSESRVPFLRFAGLVINRRIIDWLRQQRRHQNTWSLSQMNADSDESPLDSLISCPPDAIWQNMEIEEELVLLQRRLQAYGLSLTHLLRIFPKHRDSRQACLRAARLLLAEPDLARRFADEKRLPAAELARRSQTPLKSIERNRPSIIFLALLLESGLDVIKAYLNAYDKEKNT